ncbi:MAG TPA: zinc ribbon domain-containing protein [Thermomicrobiales bacterium]|nr:zinc ribbon domain-containing protein [Thermomicrobiales bacterium]
MVRCPRCGHENNEGDRFCANCGNRLTPTVPPRENITEPVTPAPVPTPAPEPEAHREEPQQLPFGPAQSSIPPPVTPSFANGGQNGGDADDDEWKMSSLGPPPRPKRRVWLWIIIAILAICVIGCCSFLFFVTATDTGQDWFNDLATQVVEEATKQAE